MDRAVKWFIPLFTSVENEGPILHSGAVHGLSSETMHPLFDQCWKGSDRPLCFASLCGLSSETPPFGCLASAEKEVTGHFT